MAKGFLTNTNDNDLLIEGGSMVIGEDDSQNIGIIAMNEPGSIRMAVTLGAMFRRLPNAREERIRSAIADLNYQLKVDGFKKIVIEIVEGKISADAER